MSKFNYEQALARLREISALLEEDVTDINRLSELVKESATLIRQCRQHLKKTEEEIENTLEGLDTPDE